MFQISGAYTVFWNWTYWIVS